MTTHVPFCFVDVFATRPLTGNPLSLVTEADGLAEPQMRAIAREFNQSETTFLLRPSLPGATWRLRSFTPGPRFSGQATTRWGPGSGWPQPDGSAPAIPPPARGWRRKSAARCWRSR
jgi:hypothetical protein